MKVRKFRGIAFAAAVASAGVAMSAQESQAQISGTCPVCAYNPPSNQHEVYLDTGIEAVAGSTHFLLWGPCLPLHYPIFLQCVPPLITDADSEGAMDALLGGGEVTIAQLTTLAALNPEEVRFRGGALEVKTCSGEVVSLPLHTAHDGVSAEVHLARAEVMEIR